MGVAITKCEKLIDDRGWVNHMITTLTETQEKLLNAYRQKWRSLSLSTERIDRTKAKAAVRDLYKLKQKAQPETLFFASPRSAMRYLLFRRGKIIKEKLKDHFLPDQRCQLLTSLCENLQKILWEQSVLAMQDTIWADLWLQIANQILPEEELLQRICEANFGNVPIDPEMKANFLTGIIRDRTLISYSLLHPTSDILGNCSWSQIYTVSENKYSSFLWNQVASQLVYQIREELETILWKALEKQTDTQVSPEFKQQKKFDFAGSILQNLTQNFSCSHPPLFQSMRPELWDRDGVTIDFCISELNCDYDHQTWEVFQALTQNCGFIFPHEDVCLVCDRPTKLSLDNQDRLHGEGEPALLFADGYSIYANHGTILPEKYGRVLPQNWQIDWLHQEPNLVIKESLILIHTTYTKSDQPISQLTTTQETEISRYQKKWYRIALSTERIDHLKASKAIKTLYQYSNQPEPNIIFCDSPHAAWSSDLFKQQRPWISWAGIITSLEEQIKKQLEPEFLFRLRMKFRDRDRKFKDIDISLAIEAYSEGVLITLDSEFGQNSFRWRRWAGDDRLLMVHNHPELWAIEGMYLDFCFSVLGCSYDRSTWSMFQEVVQHCGWIYPYKNACIVCDRPTNISLIKASKSLVDKDELIIQYSDGYCLNTLNR